jgi:hypothetical protein
MNTQHFRASGPARELLISGSPHNSLATTNLVYLYSDVGSQMGIADGSFVQIDRFVWKVGLLDPESLRTEAVRGNWVPRLEKHLSESHNTIVLNGMHRDCLGLKRAEDWAGLQIKFAPVDVQPSAAAGSFTLDVSQFPYRPSVSVVEPTLS